MESPRNTSQYLIENNSSPFFDEDDDFDYVPNTLILMKQTEDVQEDNSLDVRKISSLSTQPDSFPLEEQHLSFETAYLL